MCKKKIGTCMHVHSRLNDFVRPGTTQLSPEAIRRALNLEETLHRPLHISIHLAIQIRFCVSPRYDLSLFILSYGLLLKHAVRHRSFLPRKAFATFSRHYKRRAEKREIFRGISRNTFEESRWKDRFRTMQLAELRVTLVILIAKSIMSKIEFVKSPERGSIILRC